MKIKKIEFEFLGEAATLQINPAKPNHFDLLVKDKLHDVADLLEPMLEILVQCANRMNNELTLLETNFKQ